MHVHCARWHTDHQESWALAACSTKVQKPDHCIMQNSLAAKANLLSHHKMPRRFGAKSHPEMSPSKNSTTKPFSQVHMVHGLYKYSILHTAIHTVNKFSTYEQNDLHTILEKVSHVVCHRIVQCFEGLVTVQTCITFTRKYRGQQTRLEAMAFGKQKRLIGADKDCSMQTTSAFISMVHEG